MHQFGDALDHRGLVHLVGNFRDDDRFAFLADRLEGDLAAHHDRAAAGVVGAVDAGLAENDAAGGEIRTRHDLDQRVDRQRRIVDQRHAGVDHLAQIVRRDVGGHADGDAAGAVDQQIGEARRQHRRLAEFAGIVEREIDGVEIDVVEQRHRRLGEPRLGVAFGRRRVAVDRAEIALPVDQRQAHGEVLRQPHQRVVDRLVAMRMVFAHHVADDAGGFLVRLVRREAVLVHRVEDAPVHRLQAVAHVGQRPRHDHAHGVIEIAALHLFGDGDDANVRRGSVPRFWRIGIGQSGFLAGVLGCRFLSGFGGARPTEIAPHTG